ncbi:PREDICTED: non-specific lipid-transfer protein 1-like [Nicotiana attenuata]|uniref:Non-specific lipid-transfer protein n=1 Tax=Nicotiana attenuata TaxID=49451 RepID=A0A314LA73_NICAT|nr:PREDICTED: non-specific lipid-transfer protein 1-like [Nicotiana attenuata]OIT38482.1 non-specific lipid-transfer protein [Nicotiana attenuata]
MASSKLLSPKKPLSLLLICTVLTAALRTEALLSCDTVCSSLQPCIGNVLGGGTLPPEWCSGLKPLISIAKTRPDRQSFCLCATGAASSATPEELGRTNGLAGRCHARVPFKISPDMDCSKVK